MQGLDLLKFYENGVVSMNLPVCAQVVGSRATRTTHPRVLVDFGRLFSAVGEREFRVANDFIWQTKGEVIKTIVELGGENLIGASLSCAHVYGYSKEFPHCGTCSQCIDRRVAMVAVEKEDFDPAGGYKSDVFTGKRPEDEDRMMVATYVERANRLAKLGNVAELISQYPEVTRVLAHLPGKPGAMAEKVLDLHRRHAGEVNRAVEKMIAKHAPALRQHTLPMDCLLRLTYDSGGGVAPASPLPAPAVKVCHQKQEARWKQEEEGPNVYRLGKGYKAWHLVFQGKPEVLADERAVHLVEYLLKQRPEDGIHASVLETRVDGNPVADGFAGVEIDGRSEEVELSVGGPIQEGAGKKLMGGESVLLTRKVAELSEAIADETMPEYEREQARVELSELFSAKGRGGKMVGGAEKAADRVRKAIRSLIDELKAAEVTKGKANLVLRAFGEHLERYLWLPSRGGPGRIGASCRPGCYTYEAPPGVTWRD